MSAPDTFTELEKQESKSSSDELSDDDFAIDDPEIEIEYTD